MSDDFNTYLGHGRTKHFSEHAVVTLFSELLHACLTVVLIWDIFSHKGLLAWLTVSVVNSLLSFTVRKRLTVSNPIYSISLWNVVTGINSFLAGFIWGMVPVLFFVTDNIIYLAFIIALYTGYVSGGLAVSFSYHLNFAIFSIGLTIPFAGRMFYQGGDPYTVIGGLSIFYVLALIYVSKNSSDLYLASAKIQYNNAELVAELAREKEAVEQAVAAKDRFLASASHDLRQPLNAIGLFADALRPLQTKPLGNEIVGKIRQSLKALNGMLHGLLDISRLDAAVIENQPKPISLQTLVDHLCSEYKEKAPHLDIEYQVDQQVIVFLDANILYRVVHNLMDNAVKYTQEGGVNVVAKKMHEDTVELTISDSGIGIPEDKFATIFDEFEQLNNPERDREKGLGLGLAIVRRLCSIAEIKIDLSSKLGKGTVVSLELPTTLNQEVSNATSFAPVELGGKFALVIDDEKDILFGMQQLLTDWGCDVITSESLQQTMENLGKTNKVPDFIISDLRLRDNERGDQVIGAIREEFNKHIPAIVVTGDTAPDRVAALTESGLTVLYKPVDSGELREELGILLSQSPKK